MGAPSPDAPEHAVRTPGGESNASLQARGATFKTESSMIRGHPGTATDDDAPHDLAMRFIEVGLAIVAIVAAGILALIR
jgi:hypothetical protein